jgi:MFS transporter, SIT family, siderophore-iron:H+ symporter
MSENPNNTVEHSPLLQSRHDRDYDAILWDPTDNCSTALATTSSSVAHIEALSARLTRKGRAFIIGWAYGLDGLVRYTYQSYAASSYGMHSLVATINVLRSVIAAAAHPPAAKIADLFSRFELVAVSVGSYVIGTVIESTASSIQAFITGAILYQVGYTCAVLLVEVIFANITSMRSRVFFSYVPAAPFVVNTWVSGYLTPVVLRVTDWRWGVGMWAIIYGLCITTAPQSVHQRSSFSQKGPQ